MPLQKDKTLKQSKRRRNVQEKNHDGETEPNAAGILRRARGTIMKREQRKSAREKTPNNTKNDRTGETLSEIKSLKLWVETLKTAGLKLIKSSVESAVSIKVYGVSKVVPIITKRSTKLTDEERRMKQKLQTRALRARKLEKEVQNPLRQIQKVPISHNKEATTQLIVCTVCNEEFETQGGMNTHFAYHTESEILEAKEKHGTGEGECNPDQSVTKYHILTVYQCELCSEKCYALPMYRKHIIDKHKENKEFLKKMCFPCSFCEDAFMVKTKLIMHQRDAHQVFTQCPICNENVKTQELFTTHVNETHPDCSNKDISVAVFSEGYFCRVCGLSNKSFSHVLTHSKEHAQSKSFACDYCEEKYDNKSNLDRHKRKVHEEKLFCCELCGKRFGDRNSLRVHNRTHTKLKRKKKAECKTCGKTFANNSSYKSHHLSVHQRLRAFQCTICKKTFTCQPSLYAHKVTYCEKEKAVARICPVCGKTLDNYLLLGYHKANIHKFGNKEETVCHLCKRTMKDPSALYSHNNIYHKSGTGNKQLNLTCACCDKSCSNKMNLLDHWRKHREERPFKCSLCELTFKWPTQFYQHRNSRVHQNDPENAKLITDLEVLKKLKQDFNTAHADQFLKDTNNTETNLESATETNETQDTNCKIQKNTERSTAVLDAASDNNNVAGETGTLTSKESITDPVPGKSSAAIKKNDTDKNYVDFSRANVPGNPQGVQENTPCNCESDPYCRETPEGKPPLSPENVGYDEYFDSNDDISDSAEQPSPMDYSECDIAEENIKSFNFHKDGSYQDPFRRRLVVKVERLKECLPCNEVFSTSELYENHISQVHLSAKKEEIEVKSFTKKKANKRIKTLKNRVKSEKSLKKEIRTKDSFPCPSCNEIFSSATKYRIHSLQHKMRANCLLCTEKFVTVRKLIDHYVSEHNEEKIVKCKICDKAYLDYKIASSNNSLLRHMAYEHGPEKQKQIRCEKSYSCDSCGEKCISWKLLRIHLLSHNNDKHKCIHCPEEFNRQIELENHYNDVHDGEMPFLCEKCPQKFVTQYRLQLHKKEAHSKDKSKEIVCDVCGQTFLRVCDLTKHKTKHDPVEERHKFLCNFCGKSFLRAHTLVIHTREHTGEKPYPCTLCEGDVAFICPASLKQHMAEVHNQNRNTCDICGKSFVQRKTLVEHQRIHSADNEISCSLCSKIFHSEKKLSRHVKDVHIDETTPALTCKLCPEKFYKPGALKKHLELHDPNRPFACDKCSWRFKYSSNLNLHRKNVHEKAPIVYPKKKVAKV